MYYLFITRRFVYIGKNHRFTAFLDSKIHTRLAIVTANELALVFPLGTFPKIASRSVHVLFSYRDNKQTAGQPDRETDKPTPVIT